ncbi:MAG: orotate phosphoribosyltransferase [Rhodocyclaceae bacterium]|nr:orotate phosphoribosyltransferase [Rhodocyclaceae bacterium]MBK9624745.1 orotate phosphoribosyltransferase [Rhodocyclaceae bacterium]MBP6110233.1 orotate phosphoribosyltransferase [Rhodocyclaceae bacterium]MBP6279358.1 orotate phosphoribosyltransferase [Rhodocyclaceae bacterium]
MDSSHEIRNDFINEFIDFVRAKGVLRFGQFTTKAGRVSPYFFNAGLFNDGDSLRQLSEFYAKAIIASGLGFDTLFGPAYKGIPLAAGTAMALSGMGRNTPFAYNRKEAKDHGEGGTLVGAPLTGAGGRVLIIDDVISAGTSVRESVEMIRAAGATPVGVVIALDRQERGTGALSAVQEVENSYGIPVISVAKLADVIRYLSGQSELECHLDAIRAYREQYGAPLGIN